MMRRPALLPALGAASLIVLAAFTGCDKKSEGGAAHEAPFDSRKYAEVKQENATNGKWLLVDATATWCGPCQEMARVTWPEAGVKKWIAENGVAVAVDVDAEEATAKELNIEAMPTIIAFKDGKERTRQVGFMDAAEFLAWLNALDTAKPATPPKPKWPPE